MEIGWGQGPSNKWQAWGQLSAPKRIAGNDEWLKATDCDKIKLAGFPVLINEPVCQKLPEEGRLSTVEQGGGLARSPLGGCQWVSHYPQGLFCLPQRFGKSSSGFYFLPPCAQRKKWQRWLSPKVEWMKECGAQDVGHIQIHTVHKL